MPTAAPRPCSHAGCGVLVRDGSGRCAKHPREVFAKRPDVVKRRAGRWLQAERARMMAADPLCKLCEPLGRVTLGSIRDHIIPLAEGGTDTADNTQLICAECNDIKSKAEAARGRSRRRF